MEINLDCSDIINNEFSEFLDNNSQICINQEEGEIVGAQPVEVNTPTISITQALKTEEVVLNFQDDLEEIKQSSGNEEVEEDVFFMKELSPIRASQDCQEAPKAAAVESIRALGSTSNPQIKKLFQYSGQNEAQNKSVEMSIKGNGVASGNSNSRQWVKQPEIKAKIIGTQMLKPPVPNLVIHSLHNKDLKAETTQMQLSDAQALTLDSNRELSSTGNLPTQFLGSTATSTIPSNKQWQKVSIAKRRPITAAQNGQTNNGQRSTSTSSIIAKPKMPINISNIQNSELDDNHPRTYRELIISSPNIKQCETAAKAASNTKRRKTEPGEIVPLFDCIFCCQEHFVLSKLLEKNITKKYAQDYQSKNMLMVSLYLNKVLEIKQTNQDPQIEEPQINSIANSINLINKFTINEPYQTSLSIKYQSKIKNLRSQVCQSAKSSQKSIIPRLKLPITPVEKSIIPQPKNILNMAELDDSSIYLEDGTELPGLRRGMKTRRQKIMEQISFETDSHNIYDPYFTSEEEEVSQSPLKLPDGCDVSRLPALTSRRRLQTQYEPSSSSLNSLGSDYKSSDSEKLGEESFSSIEKEGDNSEEQIDVGVFGTSTTTVFMQLEPVTNVASGAASEEKPKQEGIEVQQQMFMATNILNIQENKFTPEQEDKESQRYTFGCITPKGISLTATGAFPQQLDSVNQLIKKIAAFSQPTKHDELIEIENINDPILSGSEQSPIQKEDQKTIQGFSPVILEINLKPGSRRMTTENPLYSDEQDSKINFHPPSQLLESLEDGNNFTRMQVQPIQRIDNIDNDSCDDMSLKMAHQAMVQNFMSSAEPLSRVVHHKPTQSLSQVVGTMPEQNSKEEVCFSPIRHENSISRDCIQAVVAAREAIQGPSFNSIEYFEGEHSSIPHYNNRLESQHQTSNQLFGNKDIMLTSNFPNNFRLSSDPAMFNPLNNFSGSMEKSDLNGSQPFQGIPSSLERQTINLGYNPGGLLQNQNHSFSAFNSKHLMVNHHQTPQVMHRDKQQLMLDPNINADYSNPSVSIGGVTSNQQFKTLITEEDQNGLSEAVRNRKKSGKKYIIKQEQLDQLLLQAFLQKQQANNTVQETLLAAHSSSDMNLKPCNVSSSGYPQLQFFDSIIKQSNNQITHSNKAVNMSDQQQHQMKREDNSQLFNAPQGEPKHHKKKQKTQDYNKNSSDGGSQKPNPLAYVGIQGINNNQSSSNLHERRVPKIPSTSIGQNSRKITANSQKQMEQLTSSNKGLKNDNVPSRQHAVSGNSRGGKNYHLSFNNVVQSSQIGQKKILEGSNDPEQDRPLTLRHHYQNEDRDRNQLEVSPNLLLKAQKNFNQPINQAMFAHHFKNQGELTQEEMTQFLKSAICSSRYSSSSATGGQVPGFAGYLPNSIHANNFGLIKQMSIDNTHPMIETSVKNRNSNSNFKDDKPLTVSPKKKLRKPHHFKQEPLLTEGTDFTVVGDNTTLIPHHHHHQLSIDNQTTIHKSSGKINDRRDSSIRASNGNPTTTTGGGLKRNNDSQKALMRKPNQQKSNKGQKGGIDLSGSLEKVPSRKLLIERAASGKQQRVKKFLRNNNEVTGSKERAGQQQKTKKTKSQAAKQPNLQYQQQKDFQTYLNLFNSINFSNELPMPPQLNPQASQSNLFCKPLNSLAPQSTSMINENTYATKNLYNSNAFNPQNASSIIPNTNHHYYNNNHFTTNNNMMNQVDTSQNNLAPLITSGAAHTSGAQFEMSTTISNNQLSLTRLASGVNRGTSNGKGNQTISSGGQNQSQVNQTTMVSKKVVIPQLQLNKIKSSSSKRINHLNGSQDEIQLQSLLLNLNQHLQANPYQTRVSLLKEGSNTVQTTPHGGQNATTSFQKGILAAAAVAQSQVINTKRSQGSSLSQQRQPHQPIEAKSSSIPHRNQDNITIDQISERVTIGGKIRTNQAQLLKQLDFSVQNIKKKQEGLTLIVPPLNLQQALATAVQNDRRQKSKDLVQVPQSTKNLPGNSPQTNQIGSITKKILQNSFTLKQLKLMNAAKVTQLTQQQQQLTGRQIDSQRPTERTVSNNNRGNQIVSIQPDNMGGGTCRGNEVGGINKEKSSQKRFSKLLIKNQKHIMSNTRAQQDDIVKIQQQLNRSSLNPNKELQIPTGKIQSRPSFPISKKKPEVDLRLQSNMTLNLSTIAPQPQRQDLASNRFYDTGKQTLISQVASPHKHLALHVPQGNPVSQTQVPTLTQVSAINTKVQNTKGMTTALGSKNSIVQSTTNFNSKHHLHSNQFSLKSIFTKNPANMIKGGVIKQKQPEQQVQQNARESLQ